MYATFWDIVKGPDRTSQVAIYLVAAKAGERARIEARRQALIAAEDALGFDPAHNAADLATLKELARKRQ